MNNVKVKALLLTVLVAASPLSASRFSDWSQLAKNGLRTAYCKVTGNVPCSASRFSNWTQLAKNGLRTACGKVAEIRKPLQGIWSKKGDLISFASKSLNGASSFVAGHPKASLASLAVVAAAYPAYKGVQCLKKARDSKKQAQKEAGIASLREVVAGLREEALQKKQALLAAEAPVKLVNGRTPCDPKQPCNGSKYHCPNHRGKPFPNKVRQQRQTGCSNGRCHR